MTIKPKHRRALVGGRTRDFTVASELEERGLVHGPRYEHLDPYGIWLELELSENGRVLADLYRAQGVQPEPEPEPKPVFDLRGLVLLQPWAALVAAGRKGLENRKWSTSVRFAAISLVGRRFALVEAGGRDAEALKSELAPDGQPWLKPVAPGHVILTAVLARVLGPDEGLGDPMRIPGWCAYVLDDVFVLPDPVKCDPKQGWMAVEMSQPKVAAAVRAQERARAR